MIRFALIAMVAVAGGCKVDNELSCQRPENADRPECRDAGGGDDDGPDAAACSNSDQCNGGVCKLPEGVCVECLVNADCKGSAEPHCDTASNTCGACKQHADCDSNACLDTGECAAETDIAYVVSNGSGTACSKAMPCTLDQAVTLARPIIKVNASGQPAILSNKLTLQSVSLTILADPGAVIAAATTLLDRMFDIRGAGATVAMFDIRIRGTVGGGDIVGFSSIDAAEVLRLERVIFESAGAAGLRTSQGGTVFVDRSVFFNNNQGGAIFNGSVATVRNSVFAANGNETSGNTGGVQIIGPGAGTIFEFNTVADNVSLTGSTQVSCNGGFAMTNNIIVGTDKPTFSALCTYSFSLFDAGAPVGNGNNNNLNGAPAFVSTSPTSPMFYRIGAASAAKDNADPSATLKDDIDGTGTRPTGADMRRDIGADELP
jgi:hypothetical protein